MCRRSSRKRSACISAWGCFGGRLRTTTMVVMIDITESTMTSSVSVQPAAAAGEKKRGARMGAPLR